jgi:hypothetical protein
MSTVKANSFNDMSGSGNAVLYGVAAPANSMGFRNRIINGNMAIDQRNVGASVSLSAGVQAFAVDRTYGYGTLASKFTVQQNAGAVTPPAGFTHYLGATSASAYTVGAGEEFELGQRVEGLNISDLGWGTANAQAVTLSFWVRSSLTGTFGGSLRNSGGSRSYPFSYTVSSANTWEQKTINIAGDTSGTWLTTNGVGIILSWGLGVGSTFSGTAGSWAGANYVSATGATSVVGTNGATFYITGVQLEVGSVATPFERIDYGRQLIQCQRYYEQTGYGVGRSSSSTAMDLVWSWKVEKRAAPSTSSVLFNGTNAVQQLGRAAVNINSVGAVFQVSVNNIGTAVATSDTGLTAGLVATSAGVNYIIAGNSEL